MESNKIIRGSLAVIVLQLLNNNGRMYGYEIAKAVKEGSKGQTQITEAALYPTLHRLEEDGYVVTQTELVDGRTRKYYKLNRQGKKEAMLRLEAMQDALKSLQKILKYRVK